MRAKANSRSVLPRVLHGAAAGLAATGPMTVVMEYGFRRLPAREQYPLPPREITEKALSLAGVRGKLSERNRHLLAMIAHAAYGATVGALYGLIFGKRNGRSKKASQQSTGIRYGIAVWAVSYLAMLPALGLLKPATKHPLRRNTLMILAHLVWGSLIGAVFNRLEQRLDSFSNR